MNVNLSRTAASPDGKKALSKADYERLSHFRYHLRCFLRISEDLCLSCGLTSLQYLLLLHLEGFPGRSWATVGELAERLQAKHHGVVALIDRCEAAGLVKRQTCTEDRRQVRIHLLKKGRKLLETIAALHQPELHWMQDEFKLPGWEATSQGPE